LRQIERLEEWGRGNQEAKEGQGRGVVRSWGLAVRKREQKRLEELAVEGARNGGGRGRNPDEEEEAGHGSHTPATAVPPWLRQLCGHTYSTPEILQIFRRLHRELLDRPDPVFPDIEILPHITLDTEAEEMPAEGRYGGEKETKAARRRSPVRNDEHAKKPIPYDGTHVLPSIEHPPPPKRKRSDDADNERSIRQRVSQNTAPTAGYQSRYQIPGIDENIPRNTIYDRARFEVREPQPQYGRNDMRTLPRAMGQAQPPRTNPPPHQPPSWGKLAALQQQPPPPGAYPPSAPPTVSRTSLPDYDTQPTSSSHPLPNASSHNQTSPHRYPRPGSPPSYNKFQLLPRSQLQEGSGMRRAAPGPAIPDIRPPLRTNERLPRVLPYGTDPLTGRYGGFRG
jgi:hypothetical protein